ncbi:LOW QUALITY PROTEIN: interleukin-1 receptor accessory protein-like [Xyrauchen texanus]|uniref:LOW QUALITY PROTEIN: interleukin-1 receptor accessory protein-like n=1 Tax=Xyrauchen texanus TaxID=154827 RepID=UPI002241C2D3|nr:LOW QUALITY PROTEIN: interleukin-1 receptor accessory protein-like [Xyrauchen texanus]
MIQLVFRLLCFCILWMGGFSASVTRATLQSDVQCDDRGMCSKGSVRVYDGEVAWLYCPLFSYPTLYSYSQTQNSSLSLLWYKQTQELEQPRLHKDREYLWIQPATEQDAGLYICMLRNISLCVKIGVELEVIHRDGECDINARPHLNISIPFQSERTLACPDLHSITLPNSTHSVTWYHQCKTKLSTLDRELKGDDVVIYIMLSPYVGVYTCVVSYQMNGHTLNFTRTLNITAVVPDVGNKEPLILNPAKDQIYSVTLGRKAELSCRVHLPHLYEEIQEIWWTIDDKTVEQLADPRFTSPEATTEIDHHGDQTKQRFLYVMDLSADDLHREFNCSARNSRGFNTSRAVLKPEPYVPTLELGFGLGVTLALMLMMFAVYHLFWLELLLLYRSWFGSDERCTDDKKYDVYISYARNSEEEEFVLSTLRRVLETEFGYSVCIFDRDSLPGGTITDDTLRFVGQSRRLVVVVSPCSAVRGTQALLELQAGLTCMLHGGSLRVVLIQFKPVRRQNWVKELRRARLALKLVRWQGEKSAPLSSRFWKQLQLELPMRKNTHNTDTHDTHTLLTEDTQHIDMHSYTHNNTHTQNALSGKEKLEDPYSTSAL